MSMIDDRPAHPLERALFLGRELRAVFDLGEPELVWLLARWRDRADVPLSLDALTLLARLVVADSPPAPITRAEAQHIATSATEDFHALEEARGAVQRYATLRGATAGQLVKLDQLVRDTWHAQHAEEVDRAA